MTLSFSLALAIACAMCCSVCALPLPSSFGKFGVDVPDALATALAKYAFLFAHNQCNLAQNYLTDDFLMYDQNGEPVNSNNWKTWCDVTNLNFPNITIASADIGWNPNANSALWHYVWNLPYESGKIDVYQEWVEVTVQNAHTNPKFSKFVRYQPHWDPAPEAISSVILHNYANQYFMNCTQYMAFYTPNSTWVTPDAVVNYTAKYADCYAGWRGVTTFAFSGNPIMHNFATNTTLVLCQGQETIGDPVNATVYTGNFNFLYILTDEYKIVTQREWYPINFQSAGGKKKDPTSAAMFQQKH